jgi:hypothetical protein
LFRTSSRARRCEPLRKNPVAREVLGPKIVGELVPDPAEDLLLRVNASDVGSSRVIDVHDSPLAFARFQNVASVCGITNGKISSSVFWKAA